MTDTLGSFAMHRSEGTDPMEYLRYPLEFDTSACERGGGGLRESPCVCLDSLSGTNSVVRSRSHPSFVRQKKAKVITANGKKGSA